MHVIIREEESTDCASNIIVTDKPNRKCRVCIDLQHLNKTRKRSHYSQPVIKDVLPELSEVKVFTQRLT